MGSKQSALTPSPNTVTTSQEGIEIDDEYDDNDDQNCCLCPFVKLKPYGKNKSSISDPMGTPILTPVHERRKRERFSEAVRKSPGDKSQQGELENETVTNLQYPRDLLIPNSNFANAALSPTQPPQHQPQVYEGKVCQGVSMIRNEDHKVIHCTLFLECQHYPSLNLFVFLITNDLPFFVATGRRASVEFQVRTARGSWRGCNIDSSPMHRSQNLSRLRL